MATIQSPEKHRYVLPFEGALAITLVMGVVITVLDVLQPAEPILSILAFFPGAISMAALFASGLRSANLNLRFGRLSLAGLLVLAATTVLLLPILSSSTGWTGWNWLSGLVIAPASGIAQELYFRGSLTGPGTRLIWQEGDSPPSPRVDLRRLPFSYIPFRIIHTGCYGYRHCTVCGGLRMGMAGTEGPNCRMGDGATQSVSDVNVDVCMGLVSLRRDSAQVLVRQQKQLKE